MSSVQSLREFISERLTAAAEEIFTEFEKTIVRYEEEIDRQRRLLDISWKPQIHLQRIELPHHIFKEEKILTEQQLCNQERNTILDQEEPELPKDEREFLEIKEELETETCMVTPDFNERNHWELEPNRDQLLSQNAPEVENQDQERSRNVEPGSCRDEELKQNKTNLKTAIYGDYVDCPNVKIDQKTPLLCMTCGKKIRNKYNLRVHMRNHTGEKPFSCQTCGKGFNKNFYLIRHMVTHTGEKPFSCETCGKSFNQNIALIRHMVTHTGEKPFSCQTCEKGFNQKFDLIRHMRTHTGEKPFSFTKLDNVSKTT
ncbi:zinc finger and SCAN domain-containing protein 2-like [Nematolebias whitei]|uniref:zinc finger and SCAN domain-containing protein 2-like n=1 Tax=Nematolebias whitei TaxID=451745 RepID=UPI0018972279|nr:zinc finger and SCAN domain-containing protein 2-like [Nematolebias whitei]